MKKSTNLKLVNVNSATKTKVLVDVVQASPSWSQISTFLPSLPKEKREKKCQKICGESQNLNSIPTLLLCTPSLVLTHGTTTISSHFSLLFLHSSPLSFWLFFITINGVSLDLTKPVIPLYPHLFTPLLAAV